MAERRLPGGQGRRGPPALLLGGPISVRWGMARRPC